MASSPSALAAATGLGLVALVPFIAGAALAWHGGGPDAATLLRWGAPYLATIVSFIGGVQWGRMLAAGRAPIADMALAVVPALVAWGALLAPLRWRVALLLAVLVLAWLVDEHGARRGWQGRGFLRLRRVLTLVVAACVVITSWHAIRG